MVLDDLVSSLEVVNSESIQAQTMGAVPTISIDKTDGCMIYLSKASLSAQIVTAKSSAMNILVPDDKGEYVRISLLNFDYTFDGSLQLHMYIKN